MQAERTPHTNTAILHAIMHTKGHNVQVKSTMHLKESPANPVHTWREALSQMRGQVRERLTTDKLGLFVFLRCKKSGTLRPDVLLRHGVDRP